MINKSLLSGIRPKITFNNSYDACLYFFDELIYIDVLLMKKKNQSNIICIYLIDDNIQRYGKKHCNKSQLSSSRHISNLAVGRVSRM